MSEEIVIIGISSGWLSHEHPGDARLLDADFFDLSAPEAQLVAAPHRLLLECACESLEDACHYADDPRDSIGIYAAIDTGEDLFDGRDSGRRNAPQGVGEEELQNLVRADLAPLWVSRQFNLHGPALRICAGECSPLAALHTACLALRNGDCDLAVAGAVGLVQSPAATVQRERHCDWRAGFVVLKRCTAAIADRDCIRAVVRRSVFTRGRAVSGVDSSCPDAGDEWQDALRRSRIAPEGIAHAAVIVNRLPARAAEFDLPNGCAEHDAKASRDHLAGLGSMQSIAAVLDTIRRFTKHAKSDAPDPLSPRQAVIATIGSDDTSAHILLEEAPRPAESHPCRGRHLLCLSAKSPQALRDATARLRDHLSDHDDLNIADVSYSLQIGRRSFGHRRAVICATAQDAIEQLGGEPAIQSDVDCSRAVDTRVVFMFPGAGAQYVGMAHELYRSEPVFRDTFDQCCRVLRSQGVALDSAVYGGRPDGNLLGTVELLTALFTVEYALARLWMNWGLQPESMIGHSVGEYVAACLSGVFTLEDALRVVAFRGQLFDGLAPGAMLSVAMSEAAVEPLLSAEVSLAAVNSPGQCVLSGSVDGIRSVQEHLSRQEIETRLLPVERAGHSAAAEPILDRFTAFVGTIRLGRPRIPFMSNCTGTWITQTEARDPTYWAAHLRQTVRFSRGVEELLLHPERVFIEVGPGRTLSTFVRQHQRAAGRIIIASMRQGKDPQSDLDVILQALGRLWTAGCRVDFGAFYSGEQRQRVPLPTYPFQRRRYWIEMPAPAEEAPHMAPVQAGARAAAPRNQLEATIAGLWQDALGMRSVGMDQRFGDLGGDERLLQQVQDRLRQEFGVSCQGRCGLTSTIASMADLVSECGLEGISDAELAEALAGLEQHAT